MALSSRPRAPAQLAKLWSTMAMGEVPDDKEQVLAERRRRAAQPEGREAPKRGLHSQRQNAHVR